MVEPYGLSLLTRYPAAATIALGVFGMAFVLTGILFTLARRGKIFMPAIRERDVHEVRKPRVGGVAMWLTLVAAMLIILGLGHTELFHFSTSTVLGFDRQLFGIFLGLLVLLLFGIWDDARGLSPAQQLLGQFLAATAIIWGGTQAEYIRLPFDHTLWMNSVSFTLPTGLGGGEIWPISAIFTYLWVIAMINVMNFFDGLDGLTGSITMTASLILFFLCLRLNVMAPATLALLLAATTAGFLPWNWHPSKVFMGTVGSQTLGFLLAVVAIISGGKVATAVLVLGIPVLDAIVVIFRRLLAKQSPFQADQRHLHHRLLKIGLKTPWVVLTINLVAIIFGVFALSTQDAIGKSRLTLVLVACMILFILVTYLLERRALKRVH